MIRFYMSIFHVAPANRIRGSRCLLSRLLASALLGSGRISHTIFIYTPRRKGMNLYWRLTWFSAGLDTACVMELCMESGVWSRKDKRHLHKRATY
jgi:hypothetical protein